MGKHTSTDNVLVLEEIVQPHGCAQEPQIWAYFGAAGGVGVTSIAVQTAHELAQIYACGDKTICLIDLDFERGACASYLDTQPSFELRDLNSASGRMDKDLAKTFIGNYKQNFSLIAAAGELGGNDNVDVNALLSLLDTISQMFDFIILDVPPMWRSWTQAVMGAADKLVLVTEMRVPALHQTKTFQERISSEMALTSMPQILINKFERRDVPHGINLKDALHVLEGEDVIQICVDDEALRGAINCGKPAGDINPDSRFVKSVRSYIQAWLGMEVIAEPKSVKLFGWRDNRQQRRA